MQDAGPSSSTEAHAVRRHSLLARLLLATTVLLVGLLAVEIGERVMSHRRNQETLHAALSELHAPSDASNAGLANIVRLSMNDRIMYELQPGLRDRTFRESRVSTSADGFRVTGEPRPLGPEGVTIVGIGDSVMFGHGVEDDETYLSLLQEVLATQNPEHAIRVVNSAVPGYNTVMEVETLRTKCLALEPDLVILHIVGNDYAPPRFVRRQEDVFALDRSFLWERVSGREDRLRQLAYQLGEVRRRGEQEEQSAVPEAHRALYGREAFLGAVDELIASADEHGFDLIVFTNNELGREPAMVREAVIRGVEHVSLTPDLRAWLETHGGLPWNGATYHASALVVGPDNGHPSAQQHRMAARRLARWLRESGWLDRKLDGSGGGREPEAGSAARR